MRGRRIGIHGGKSDIYHFSMDDVLSILNDHAAAEQALRNRKGIVETSGVFSPGTEPVAGTEAA